MNTTGIIVGRLSIREIQRIIIECDDKEIRMKFMRLLDTISSQEGEEDLVISEYLK